MTININLAADFGLRVSLTGDLKIKQDCANRYGILMFEIKTSKWGKVSALE